MVWLKIQNSRNEVAAGDYIDWKQQNAVFEDRCAWTGTSFNLATKDQPEYLDANEAPHHHAPSDRPVALYGTLFPARRRHSRPRPYST
jgi:hypothetical protein